MPELGHMAYYVRNLERSVAFYQKVVGLTVIGRIFKGRAAVLSGGNSHHELLLIQISTADGPLTGRRIGLYHAGWKMGSSLHDLKDALDRAQTYGIQIDGSADHGMIFSLYLKDPDNNEVELFVDNPDYDWRQDTSWMDAPVKPLDLSFSCLTRAAALLQLKATRDQEQPLLQEMAPTVHQHSATRDEGIYEVEQVEESALNAPHDSPDYAPDARDFDSPQPDTNKREPIYAVEQVSQAINADINSTPEQKPDPKPTINYPSEPSAAVKSSQQPIPIPGPAVNNPMRVDSKPEAGNVNIDSRVEIPVPNARQNNGNKRRRPGRP